MRTLPEGILPNVRCAEGKVSAVEACVGLSFGANVGEF